MEVRGQLQSSADLPPGKEPLVPLDRRLGGPQSWSDEEKNSQPLPGLEPPIIQPVTQRYTTELSQGGQARVVRCLPVRGLISAGHQFLVSLALYSLQKRSTARKNTLFHPEMFFVFFREYLICFVFFSPFCRV
jgi:hypothetical protein